MKKIAHEILVIARFLAANWKGAIPKTCQVCDNLMKEQGKTFYDAKIVGGRRAIVCEQCFKDFGIRLNREYGQQYDLSTGRLLAGDQPPEPNPFIEFSKKHPEVFERDFRLMSPEAKRRFFQSNQQISKELLAVAKKIVSDDQVLQDVASVVKKTSFLSLRSPLMQLGLGKVDFIIHDAGPALWHIHMRSGKTIGIVDKKSVDVGPGDILAGNFVVGYL